MSAHPPHDPSRPLALADWDVPCLNCGRYGTIQGQMITDSFNNTFCSPDCGWSHLLRPYEQHRAAKAAAAAAAAVAAGMHTGGAARTRRPSRRSSRHHHQLQSHQHHSRAVAPAPVARPRKPVPANDRAPSVSPSARRPPRLPHRTPRASSKPRSAAAEQAASVCEESGDAMFDFLLMTGWADFEE